MISMSRLEEIIARGNRRFNPYRAGDSTIHCADGFGFSVIAGQGTYCTPRPDLYGVGDAPADYPGPYTHVEIGFPTRRPEPWSAWGEYAEDGERPTGTVYGYVPVALVRALVASHGGEVA